MKKMTAFPFTSKLTYDEKGWPMLDRAVDSVVLRKLMKDYFTNGVHGIGDSTCLQVSALFDGSDTVYVSPGEAMIQGATGYIEDIAELPLTAADNDLPRIDTVVVRLNDNIDFRNMYLDIVIGTPSSVPVAPALTRSDSIWEIGLADLYRTANSTIITNSSITDTRLDSERCGYVTAIDRLDTASLMKQLNAWYKEFVAAADSDYAESRQYYLTLCQEIVDALLAFESVTRDEVLEWFELMKGQLSEDAAVNLQNQLNDLKRWRFVDGYLRVPYGGVGIDDGYLIIDDYEGGE